MRVAIYYPWIYLKSGIERTIMELKHRSRHAFTIFTSHFDAGATYPELSSMGIVELPRVSVERNYRAVALAAARIATTRIDLREHDALVVCCDGLGTLLNFRNATVPRVCLCFTPLRAVYDEEYRRRHLSRRGILQPAALAAEWIYRQVDRAAWRRFDQVVCISQTVRDRVARGGLYPADAMRIAYPGIPGSGISPNPEPGGYFFLPGRIMWTKNIELAIDAFKSYRARTASDHRLIIAGMVDRKSQGYYERLVELAADEPAIEFRVGPDDAGMQKLYRESLAILLTAFNEDYGLTPLEAGCHGKPTIAVARGGPTEIVVNEETGLLCEPDPETFCAAMLRLAAAPDLVRKMGLAAARRCSLFTWEQFVTRIDDGLDEVAASATTAPA